MQEFWLYFNLGREHIADWKGYDHILFVTALCLGYLWKDWKKVLILITAFTIGHSITLALSTLNYIDFSTTWIEFIIPITIIITVIKNIYQKNVDYSPKIGWTYSLALFFGLVHGLGFSNYLKSLLGKDTNIITQLLAFNLGLEIGQLLIVVVVLLLSWICVNKLKFARREYILFLSGAIFGIAFIMALERFPLYKKKNNEENSLSMLSGTKYCWYQQGSKHSKQP